MARKKHSAEEIIRKLRQSEVDLGEGQTIGQVCQKLEISEPTLHRWRARYGGMKADDAKRLKELELENTRLKRLVANLSLDKAMLEELASGKW
jgi:putative transposase